MLIYATYFRSQPFDVAQGRRRAAATSGGESMKDIAIVMLAAGKSTRMRSKTSKVLHKVAGQPIIAYSISAARRLNPKKIVIVVGRGQQGQFEEALGKDRKIEYCVQAEARGTGHAVAQAEKCLIGFDGYIMILPGDVPLIWPATLEAFVGNVMDEGAVCSIISTEWPDPNQYGRVLRNKKGGFKAIREARDATDAERDIHEINSGIFLVKSKWLFGALKNVKPHNAQKEYYLTDIIEMAVGAGDLVTAHCFSPHEQFVGINDRSDLAFVKKIMNSFITEYWMEMGVGIDDPEQTYIDSDVLIGEDTTIAPSVFLRGKTSIGRGCFIDTGSILENAVIGDHVHVKPYSVIEDSKISNGAVVGPFSRVRPGSVIGKEARIGNFVEIKKSVLKPGVKANHLSYIGDATIGAKTNVGCGTITCNYDGKNKHRTIIGEGVFIGSDVQFVAPVRIGRGAVIGAGSTVTKNVPPKALALSRVEQVNVKGWAGRKRSK